MGCSGVPVRAALVAVMVGTACADEPRTTDFCGGHAEYEVGIELWPVSPEHLVFVVDPELRERMVDLIANTAEDLISGDLDRDGNQERYAVPYLRVAVLTPAEAAALAEGLKCSRQSELSCPPTELPYATYRYHPYGHAEDPAAFLDEVRCLAVSPGRAHEACAVVPDAEADSPGWLPPLQVFAFVVVVTAHDLCAETDPNCARDPLRALLSLENVQISLVTGIPGDLADRAGVYVHDYRDAMRLEAIANDSRLAEGAEPIACGGFEAEPPARFLGALDGPAWVNSLLSLCTVDHAALADGAYYYCGGGADGTSWAVFPPDGPRLEPNGRAICELRETLPDFGPITRCDQLQAFGRVFDGTTEDGREICALEQLVVTNDSIPNGYGFYYAPEPLADRPQRPPSRSDFRPRCYGFISSSDPQVSRSPETELIPGSQLTLRCTLAHPGDSSCPDEL